MISLPVFSGTEGVDLDALIAYLDTVRVIGGTCKTAKLATPLIIRDAVHFSTFLVYLTPGQNK
jgi:hypothetical protein